MSVGEALLFAKEEYAADLTVYGVYDEKVLMEATFYGLPFYRLDVANPPPEPPQPPAPVISTDPITGIDTSTIEVTPVTEERDGDDGSTYFVGIGDDDEEQTTAVHDRPVQPRDETSFTAPAGTRGPRRPRPRPDHHRPARHRAAHPPAGRRQRRRAQRTPRPTWPSRPARSG